jgi:hypothetical protein
MPITCVRTAAILIATVAGLLLVRDVSSDAWLAQLTEDDEAQLANVLSTIEAETLARTAPGNRARAKTKKN